MSKGWQIYRWYCPNCGELVYGYKCKDGSIKTVCPKCAIGMKREATGRRHDVLNLYAPKETKRLGIVG
jgi:DNA-directed RNA polymerase subunit M/transcription elongation factor TFIIS